MPPVPGMKPIQVPLDQCGIFACDTPTAEGPCGSKKFRPLDRVQVLFNRFKPREAGLNPLIELECIKCGSVLLFDEDGAKRLEECAAKLRGGDGKKNG